MPSSHVAYEIKSSDDDENNEAAVHPQPMPLSVIASSGGNNSSYHEDKVSTVSFHDTNSQSEGDTTCSTDSVTRASKKRKIIPFTAQVILCICVPVGFLIMFATLLLVEAVHHESFINQHRVFIQTMFECENNLMLERGRSSGWLGLANASQEIQDTAFDKLEAARKDATLQCEAAIKIGDDSSFKRILIYTDEFNRLWLEKQVMRHQVTTRLVGGLVQRKFDTLMIVKGNALLGIMAELTSLLSKKFLQLKSIRRVTNYFGHIRAVGADLVNKGPNAEAEVITDLQTAYDFAGFFERDFKEGQDGQGAKYYTAWKGDEKTTLMYEMVDKLASGDYSQYADVSNEEWFGTMSDGLKVMQKYDRWLLSDAVEGRATQNLITSVVLLVCGLLFSFGAAWWIIDTQYKSTQETEKLILRNQQFQVAVQAFVPRQFLKKMGYQSILHTKCGDQTEIAVTMLFSDIKSFTTISEAMGNRNYSYGFKHTSNA